MSEFGSIQFGSDEDLHVTLREVTVAALEETVTRCVHDGRSFTLRFFGMESGQVVSTVVSPSSTVKFSYKLGVDPEERDAYVQECLAAIIETGTLSVSIPKQGRGRVW